MMRLVDILYIRCRYPIFVNSLLMVLTKDLGDHGGKTADQLAWNEN
jgi:hypothetical protein